MERELEKTLTIQVANNINTKETREKKHKTLCERVDIAFKVYTNARAIEFNWNDAATEHRICIFLRKYLCLAFSW